jgi:hypothetical protein
VWMLRFAQHDKLGSWIPHFADASVSMTGAVSFRALFSCHSERLFLSFRAPFPVIPSALFLVIPSAFSSSFRAPFPVIPSESEESSAWMLHFVQHDKSGVIPSESEESMTLFVLAKADVSLRLRSMQHDGASARYQSIISSIRIFLSEHSLNNVNTT